MPNIKILLSFIGLWLTSYLSNEHQTMLGLALVFSFGILHGANDLKLINHIEPNKKVSFVKIIGAYLVLVLISVILFIQIPPLALFIFIIVSAYHFGEQNWQEILERCSKKLKIVFQMSYGMLILFALFYFNADEVIRIILKISTIKISKSILTVALLISILLYVVTSVLISNQKKGLRNSIIEQSFYILLLCIIFKVASLFLGFAIYFIFWHSIPSLHDQIKFLYGSYSLQNFIKYFKSAFLYWFISLVGVFALYYISKDMLIFDSLFFSFLASITFPHFIIIVKMYQKENSN